MYKDLYGKNKNNENVIFIKKMSAISEKIKLFQNFDLKCFNTLIFTIFISTKP